jgi:glycosidase
MMFSYLRGRSPYYRYGERVNNLKIGLVLGALQNTSMMIIMGDEIVREDTGFPFLLSNMRFHDKTIKPNNSLAPDTEIRTFYQKLIQAKLNYPILSNGIFNELYSNNELLVIEKTIEGSSKKALIIINKYFNPQNVSVNLPQSYKGLTSNEILSGENLTASEDSQIQLNVKEESIQVHIFN